eukprot:jgi/Mesvir1/18904/Mv25782-RA.1
MRELPKECRREKNIETCSPTHTDANYLLQDTEFTEPTQNLAGRLLGSYRGRWERPNALGCAVLPARP